MFLKWGVLVLLFCWKIDNSDAAKCNTKTRCKYNGKCYPKKAIIADYPYACAYLQCTWELKVVLKTDQQCVCEQRGTSARRGNPFGISKQEESRALKPQSRSNRKRCAFNGSSFGRGSTLASAQSNFISLKCKKKGRKSRVYPVIQDNVVCTRKGGGSTNTPYAVPGEDGAHPCDAINPDDATAYDNWIANAKNKQVVIVGAGVSGLAAAAKLEEKNIDYVVLEAQGRTGGRVKTFRKTLQPSGIQVITEEGAEWINGGPKNILYHIALHSGTGYNGNLADLRPDNQWQWFMRNTNGKVPPSYGVRYEKGEAIESKIWGSNYPASVSKSLGDLYYDEFLKASIFGNDPTSRSAWLYYFEQRICIEIGTASFYDISGIDALNYVELGDEENGDKFQWLSGYDTVKVELEKNMSTSRIELNTPVCYIDWNDADPDRALVVTSDGGSYWADQVLVTTSSGHLKDRLDYLFHPAPPAAFRTALSRTRMGTVNKFQMWWDKAWWSSTRPALSLEILWEKMDLPTEMEWMYNIMEIFSVRGDQFTLQCFVNSGGSQVFESLSQETALQHVMFLMKKLLPQINIPQPLGSNRSKWRSNVWVKGSYNTFIHIDGALAGMSDRKDLRETWVNTKGKKVVFFGGEHTSDDRYSTVDGAIQTGWREGLNIVSARGL